MVIVIAQGYLLNNKKRREQRMPLLKTAAFLLLVFAFYVLMCKPAIIIGWCACRPISEFKHVVSNLANYKLVARYRTTAEPSPDSSVVATFERQKRIAGS
jgi:hypothetical protein